MILIDLDDERSSPVTQFSSRGVSSQPLADGAGEAHAYHLAFEPNGEIGPHPTGFAQLLIPLTGEGWVADGSGQRHPINPRRFAWFDKGEMHSKGSNTGMTALMLQCTRWELTV